MSTDFSSPAEPPLIPYPIPEPAELKVPVPLSPLPDQPQVSVLITSFNYASFIGSAIESVLTQTNGVFELIICDDGSTDDSPRIVKSYCDRDSRVRLIEKPNGGQASAFNRAYEECSGQIIALLDADDTFYPTKIEHLVSHYRKHPDVGFVLHKMDVVDASGAVIQTIPSVARTEEGWIADRIISRGGRWRAMPTSGISFRRELGAYMFPIPVNEVTYGADAFLFTLLPLLTELGWIQEPLSKYRVHGNNAAVAFQRNEQESKKAIQFLDSMRGGVNKRLIELGQRDRFINLFDNLDYLEQRYSGALFARESRRALWRRYLPLAHKIRRDDLYRPVQKIIRLVVYGTAPALPRRFRPKWLSAFLTPNRSIGKYQEQVLRLRRTGRSS